MKCNQCPRNCNVNRNTQTGFCGALQTLKVAHASLHMGEEPPISGTKGSGTIFFCHCNLKCVFCQNAPVRDGTIGKEITPEHLALLFKKLEGLGAHNINLVSPTQYATQIIEALKIYKPTIPVVYNTNGYEKEQTLLALAPYVDIFLTDLKYMDPKLSTQYSACPNYFEVASRALKIMRTLKPDVLNQSGIMQQGVIVRHLVLPGCTKDSLKVMDYLSNSYPSSIISVMSQYTPCGNLASFPELGRTLKPIEYHRVLRHLQSKHKGTIFGQEITSATKSQIPAWDSSTLEV